MPVLFSLFYAIQSQASKFSHETFLWIGPSLHAAFPAVIGASIQDPDVLLFALYVVSMYLSVRFGTPPSTDPQVAQTNKIMSVLSPAMLAFIGFKAHWPAALVIYWISFNILTMAQQLIMYRRYGIVGGNAAAAPLANVTPPAAKPKNGKPPLNGKNGSALPKAAKNKR
jgi:membrane protein insertase Oxa1/YidC/SpoIIIJ